MKEKIRTAIESLAGFKLGQTVWFIDIDFRDSENTGCYVNEGTVERFTACVDKDEAICWMNISYPDPRDSFQKCIAAPDVSDVFTTYEAAKLALEKEQHLKKEEE